MCAPECTKKQLRFSSVIGEVRLEDKKDSCLDFPGDITQRDDGMHDTLWMASQPSD